MYLHVCIHKCVYTHIGSMHSIYHSHACTRTHACISDRRGPSLHCKEFGGERQAQTVSFRAPSVSPDRRLVQARLAQANDTRYAAGILVTSHLGKTRELAAYCGFVFQRRTIRSAVCCELSLSFTGAPWGSAAEPREPG